MSTSTKTTPETPATELSEKFAPRQLTFAENAKLTGKVIGGLGLVGLALWGAEQWITGG